MPPGTHYIRSSDRLAMTRRGGMHGTQAETGEQIEQSFTHGAVHRREEAVIERCSIACLEPNGEAKFVHIASRHARPVGGPVAEGQKKAVRGKCRFCTATVSSLLVQE